MQSMFNFPDISLGGLEMTIYITKKETKKSDLGKCLRWPVISFGPASVQVFSIN